jgi:hypothetical protein
MLSELWCRLTCDLKSGEYRHSVPEGSIIFPEYTLGYHCFRTYRFDYSDKYRVLISQKRKADSNIIILIDPL